MRRLASSVLVLAGVLTGLVLVSPPAHAVLSVTIYASASTVPEGSTVTFTGRATDARLGSVVRLQRQRTDGSWAVVASRKLVDTRRYRFTTTPPRGYQKYRVVKPAQLGQPGRVSATKTIKVTWRPGVTLGTVKHQVVDYSTGAVTTSTNGRTTRLSAGFELRRELQRSDGTWALHGRVRIASDQTWRDRFSSRHGQRFRYVAPASGSRLARASSSFVVDGHWTPTITASASVDEDTGKARLRGSTTGLAEGVVAQLQYIKPDGIWSDTGPKISVDADGTYSQIFEPSMTATYRVSVPASGLRRAAYSASFQVAGSGPMRVDLNSNISVVFPRGSTQRTLLVAIEEGQTFTYSGPYGLKVNVSDPAGNAMPGFESPIYPMTAIAPSTGDYLITLTMAADEVWENTANIALSKPRVIDTAIDGPATDLANDFRGQLVDLQFVASSGAMISEFSVEYTDVTRQLLDPAGEVVPRFFGSAKLWQVENSGRYTLRFSPTTSWSRSGQEVLSAESVAMTLDGSPAQIHLDRPGRTGVATVDVPVGVDLQVSNIDDSNLSESLVSPDRKEVSGSSVPSTQAGTYYQIVSTRSGSADVDYYATTPLEIVAAPGGTTSYDRGPAPHRKLDVAIPVTAGQLLSFEVLDDTQTFCTGAGFGNTATDPIDWILTSDDHPGVFSADESGVVDLDVTPCSATGSIRLTEVTMVKPTWTGSTVDGAGRTVETHEITVEATQPGQVMLVDYNPGTHLGEVEMRATGSTFSAQTTYSLGVGFPPTAFTTSLSPVPFDRLWTSKSWSYPWRQYYFVYAGATETGTLDLQFTYTHG